MGEFYDANAPPEPYSRDSESHARSHYAGSSKQGDAPGRDPIPGLRRIRDELDTLYPNHALLGPLHAKTTTGDPVRGDIITAQGATPLWTKLARSVPGVGLRNFLGLANGDTEPAWKAFAHNLLSTDHGDTLADTVVDGDVIIGNVTPKWSRLARSVPGAGLMNVLGIENGETRPSWKPTKEQTSSLTANQALTDSSTAFQNVTFPSAFALAANEIWRFSMTVIFISSLAADFKLQFTVPAGATLYFSTGPVVFGAAVVFYASLGAASPATADGTTGNVAIELSGTVINGGTAGNLQLQAAQNTATADAGADKVLIGTNYFARRVA